MKVQFDDFSVDLGSRQLLHLGKEAHLSPKAFELLRILLEQRPRAVSKQELFAQLWPSTHVSDVSLAVLIAELRRTLDDSSREPRYIRTVARFGYAFSGQTLSDERSQENARFWLISESTQIPLREGSQVIGRADDVDVRIVVPGVSRHHARFDVSSSGASVEDLGSKNGTFVNDRRIAKPLLLASGDRIRIGTIAFTLREWIATAETMTQAPKRASKV